MTPMEQLRSELLSHYDPYTRPVLHEDHYTTVYVHFSSDHIQLDEKKSLLTTHGKMLMNWIDEKIVWDPENYDNISFLYLASHEVWIPEIMLYNAAGHGGSNVLEDEGAGLLISSEGKARWTARARLSTWCNADLRYWPRDRHTCSLRLGFWTLQQPRLILQLDNLTQVSEQKTGSQWEVTDLTSRIVWDTEVWANGITDYEEQLNEQPTSNLVIQIQLSRCDQSYIAILTAPLIVINISTFLSFWMSPNTFAKTLFVCLALVISSVVTAVLADFVPVHPSHTPHIIVAYSRSMVAALISLLLSVTTICLGRYSHMRPLPSILYKHITSEHVCTALFLPRNRIKETMEYCHLDETNPNTRAITVPNHEIQQQWLILTVYINRVSSIVFCLFIGVTLATC